MSTPTTCVPFPKVAKPGRGVGGFVATSVGTEVATAGGVDGCVAAAVGGGAADAVCAACVAGTVEVTVGLGAEVETGD